MRTAARRGDPATRIYDRAVDASAPPPITARLYRDGDEEAVLALLGRAFGSWPLEPGLEDRSREFFHWKHLEGPWGPSTMYVAEADGAIVGFRGYMPWRLAVRDRIIPARQAVDAATEPAAGRRGVFNVISAQAVEERQRLEREAPRGLHQIVFSTPNALSKGAAERATGVAATYGVVIPGRFGFSVGLRRARMFRRRVGLGGRRRPVRAPDAADVLEDSAGAAALLQGAESAERRIATARSVDYLRWRYPRFLGYAALVLERNGELAGLAIFRVRDAGYGYQEARVAELLARPGDRRTLRKLLDEVARRTSAEWITCCFFPGSEAGRAAASAGLAPAEPEMTLLLTLFGAEIEPDPTRIDSWALTLGEVEELI